MLAFSLSKQFLLILLMEFIPSLTKCGLEKGIVLLKIIREREVLCKQIVYQFW
jgi:hypothetical protein